MSAAATRQSRNARHLCQSCKDRRARFSYRGVVKADRDHTLCFQCFRAERERGRARRLLEARTPSLPFVLGTLDPSRSLTARQVTHRQHMLRALGASRPPS